MSDMALSYGDDRERTDLILNIQFGSGAGIRTLNLAVNRSLKPVRKWRSEFA